MTRNSARLLLATIAGLGLVAIVLWLLLGRSGPQSVATGESTAQESAADSSAATLFFPGPGGRLSSEARELPAETLAEARVQRVVEAVLSGPESSGLFAPLPEGIEVGSVLLAIDGTAFIDLVTNEGSAKLAWGSKHELLAVYSLVNSVLTNEPQARRVMLLWNGQQRPTFAGHVDLTRPLILHSGLIAKTPGAS